MIQDSNATAEAEQILSGRSETPKNMLALAKRLAREKQIGLARRLLKRSLELPLSITEHADVWVETHQKSALYTYKDPDLPLEFRLDRALEILSKAEDLHKTTDQETLGLAGAIWKRKWEVNGLRQNLEQALFHYLRGYSQGMGDNGYCAINAAFVLDLLAHEEMDSADRAGYTQIGRKDDARIIRAEIVAALAGKNLSDWWFFATLGEAYFGLGLSDATNYDKAVEWLVERPMKAGLRLPRRAEPANGIEVPEWEYESTARQLARLARLHCPDGLGEKEFLATDAGKALVEFLGNDQKALASAFRGKLGLALSGGGFRASLFHIGVLARLAELDVLRHVEALSCVSGGSIIGAHYYLEVRHLLQTKTDDKIDRKDYVEIVKRIEDQFLKGVQRNIRTRVLAEWLTNVQLFFSSTYTRTKRVGELYERELFARVSDIPDGSGGFRGAHTGPGWLPDWLAGLFGLRRDPRYLSQLFVHPLTDGGALETTFQPRNHNWRRSNKAPVLVLNAATLNTGHGWQFTASYMGEPPAPIDEDVDCNDRLRRMYYGDAPAKYRNFRLGDAVAASSCVPGLFEPLVLDGLYPYDFDKVQKDQRVTVRLVDGGCCDNQGIASLLEQDCRSVIVSDASGQMEMRNDPGGGTLQVLLRTNNLFQARVRETQYTDVATRRHGEVLDGLLFIHLRQDLRGRNQAWNECPSSRKESDFERTSSRDDDATSYGIAKTVQRKLSEVRTDLDSFHDAEAYALMASGYRTIETFFPKDKGIFNYGSDAATERWRFLAVESAMRPGVTGEAKRNHLERLLSVAANVPFKVWQLSGALVFLKWLLALAALAIVVAFLASKWNDQLISLTYKTAVTWIGGAVAIVMLTALAKAIFGKTTGGAVVRVFKWRDTIRRYLALLGMATVGWLAARLHLHVFDKLYLRLGKLDKFP